MDYGTIVDEATRCYSIAREIELNTVSASTFTIHRSQHHTRIFAPSHFIIASVATHCSSIIAPSSPSIPDHFCTISADSLQSIVAHHSRVLNHRSTIVAVTHIAANAVLFLNQSPFGATEKRPTTSEYSLVVGRFSEQKSEKRKAKYGEVQINQEGPIGKSTGHYRAPQCSV